MRKGIESNGIIALCISVGVIFVWFGFLKFFESTSPAENIASRTILWLTNGWLEPHYSMPILGTLECFIGIGIWIKKWTNHVLPLMYFQMLGTLLPLFVFREDTWQSIPLVPTLEGQYIIKNAVLISEGIVLGAISQDGKLIHDSAIAHRAEQAEKRITINK
ncbi:hypothetical protein [Flavobacterium caeni]|uniref:hypothetical protein n=1 Tax=Flavobacterium caeni TaxID=490189 RepID=UPI0011131B20|nr:hypothetical protein [Flavobacterium caeni]